VRLRDLVRLNSLATQVIVVAAASLIAFTVVLLVVVSNTVANSVEKEIQSQVEVADRTLRTLLEVHGGTPVVIGRTLQFNGWIANGDIELVDEVKHITGCDATIYQMLDGKPIAISTTMMQDGKRIVGSELLGPARAAIENRQTYEGTEPFNGEKYVVMYEPIIDDAGALVGALHTAKPATALSAAANVSILRVAGTSVVALVLILMLVLWVLRNIRRDAYSVSTVAHALASGILDDTADVTSQNELGEIAGAFDEMIAYQREMADTAEAIASGDLSRAIQPHARGDRLGTALARMNENLASIVGQIQRTSDSLAASSTQLGMTSERSSRMVAEATIAMAGLAKGYDVLSEAAASLDAMVRQFSIGVDAIARGAVDQAAQVNVASKDAARMFEDVERLAHISMTLAAAGEQTKTAAASGERAVADTVSEMNAIAEVVRAATQKIRELENLSAQIGSIVEAVEEIAEQTNLLALNAAIEAARAGEHGRGFAVVADEVRKLAERSAAENKQIGQLVREVQSRTREAVNAVGAGAAKVSSGTEKAATGGAALREILQSIDQTVAQVAEIAEATDVMARSAKSLTESIDSISHVVEENSAGTKQMAAQTTDITASIGAIAATSSQHRMEAERVARISLDVRTQVEEVQEQALELDETARALRKLTTQFTTDGRHQLPPVDLPAIASRSKSASPT
jgi:methyl-accepting chemotaxis protein